jgi:two-component system copper resistance phosphate regulon response regulator CusR
MRLLLIEDEEKVMRFVRRGLEAERYAIDVAADGRRAVELATAYPYDMVILDLMLPGLSGTEALRGRLTLWTFTSAICGTRLTKRTNAS